MLSPTDVHYLVGFLSQVGQPEDVELELGSMVFDEAAEGDRDVDVTLTRRAGTAIECFRGIEVKAHTRPLDVEDVEQLCVKLNDLPALTYRAVVSASGYTDKGRRKAEKHGIELLRLDDWDREKQVFGSTTIHKYVTWTNRWLAWDSANVNLDVAWKGRVTVPILGRLRVTTRDGRAIPHLPDVDALTRQILARCTDDCRNEPTIAAAPTGERMPKEYRVTIGDQPRIWIGTKWGAVREAYIKGHLVWREEVHEPRFKILVRDTDSSPFAACLLAELPDGSLAGFAVQATQAPLAYFTVPISDRNKKKIRRETWPLRRSPSDE